MKYTRTFLDHSNCFEIRRAHSAKVFRMNKNERVNKNIQTYLRRINVVYTLYHPRRLGPRSPNGKEGHQVWRSMMDGMPGYVRLSRSRIPATCQDARIWSGVAANRCRVQIGAVLRSNSNPSCLDYLSIGRQGRQSFPDSVPATRLPHPRRVRLPDPQDRLQGRLFCLQGRIDPVPQGPRQLPAEVLDWV